MKRIVTLFAITCSAATIASAQNLLGNADFNTPNNAGPNPAPAPWTTWTWPDWNGAWANQQNDGSAFDGTPYMAVGNWNGTAYSTGFYETVGATAGVSYQLSVESGAQAWWRPEGEMRLIFLDAGNNVLAQHTVVTVDPNSWSANDQGQPWNLFSLAATAPVNTTQAKAEFVMNGGQVGAAGGGTVWFDNASLSVVPEPGTVALAAAGAALLLAHTRRTRRS
jgi:PEP-CTERM motif